MINLCQNMNDKWTQKTTHKYDTVFNCSLIPYFVTTFPPSLREYNSLLSLICKQTTLPLPLLYYSLLLELFSDDGDRCLTGVSLLNSSATTLSFSNSIYRVLALTDKDFAGEQSLQRRTLVVEWRRRRQDLSVSYSRSEND